MLAGFAFDCYNDPVDAKWDQHKDGSKIAFISSDFVRESFEGVLTVSVLRIEEPDQPGQGLPYDAYASVFLEDASLTSSSQETPPKPKNGKGKARWGDTFVLYVKDLASARIHFLLERVRGVISNGALVASATLALADVLPYGAIEDDFEEWTGWVDLAAEEGEQGRPARAQLELRFVPFGETFTNLDEREEKVFEGPKGGTPDLDWRVVSSKFPMALEDSRRFERLAFVDEDSTDTQCAVWRDAARRRVLIAFRGTSHWRDVLTDASIIQEPLGDALAPLDEVMERWEAARLRERRHAAMALLDDARGALAAALPEGAGGDGGSFGGGFALPGGGGLTDIVNRTTAALSTGNLSDVVGGVAGAVGGGLPDIGEMAAGAMGAVNLTQLAEGALSRVEKLRVDVDEEVKGALQAGVSVAARPPSLPSNSLKGLLQTLGNSVSSLANSTAALVSSRREPSSEPLAPQDVNDIAQRVTTFGTAVGQGTKVVQEAASAAGDYLGQRLEGLKGANLTLNVSVTNMTQVDWSVGVQGGKPGAEVPDLRELVRLPEVKAVLAEVEKVRQAWNDVAVALPEPLPPLPNITDMASKALLQPAEQAAAVRQLQGALRGILDLNQTTEGPMVHSGFRQAYTTVRASIMDVLSEAMGGEEADVGDWHVYCTGHSLGGALATLATLDIARGGIGGQQPKAVTMYNYGSPRVGNKAFVELYNQLNGDSFRLVNNLDIVTSLPRQALASMLAEYDHVGRTVVVDHEGVPGNVWVEGIDEGECPVRLRDAARAQKGLIETEMALLQSIVAGEAVSQHLEPYYFVALCAAVGLDPPEQFAALRSSDGPSNWVWTA